jgi:hypothetical protein
LREMPLSTYPMCLRHLTPHKTIASPSRAMRTGIGEDGWHHP